MRTLLHRASDRGGGDYGWLKTQYSFSFASWFEPRRMGFGALRVLNDDLILPGGKFEMHSHKDFEIITLPLRGAVTHEDSLRNRGVVAADDVQVMTAGTGITHAEANESSVEPLELFQIWIAPRVHGASPRYDQKGFDPLARYGRWQTLVSADGSDGSLTLMQNARIARADLGLGDTLTYTVSHSGNGMYLMIIEGEAMVDGDVLGRRDAVGVSGTSSLTVDAHKDTQLLMIDVPMA